MNTTETKTMTKTAKWEVLFRAALESAMQKAGVSSEGLRFERCDTDRTWGDRCGLVFFGAAPDVCERAAKFFEAWAHKNLRKLGVVGGYTSQESINFEGAFYFSAYDNGAKGWHRVRKDTVMPVAGVVQHIAVAGLTPFDLACTEVRQGFATSYVYYPCAD